MASYHFLNSYTNSCNRKGYGKILAVRVENIVRAYMHNEYKNSNRKDIYDSTNPRTTYGGIDIQPELDKIEKDKVGFPQPKPKNK